MSISSSTTSAVADSTPAPVKIASVLRIRRKPNHFLRLPCLLLGIIEIMVVFFYLHHLKVEDEEQQLFNGMFFFFSIPCAASLLTAGIFKSTDWFRALGIFFGVVRNIFAAYVFCTTGSFKSATGFGAFAFFYTILYFIISFQRKIFKRQETLNP